MSKWVHIAEHAERHFDLTQRAMALRVLRWSQCCPHTTGHIQPHPCRISHTKSLSAGDGVKPLDARGGVLSEDDDLVIVEPPAPQVITVDDDEQTESILPAIIFDSSASSLNLSQVGAVCACVCVRDGGGQFT